MRQRLAPESNRIADKYMGSNARQRKMVVSERHFNRNRGERTIYKALCKSPERGRLYVEASDEAKRFHSTYYKLIKDTGETAPILRGRDGSLAVYDPNLSDMTGEELEQIRSQLNLTLREFADIIGVRDPRTVRRYETMDHVPPQVAETARKAHLR